jgi:hypothetical protein
MADTIEVDLIIQAITEGFDKIAADMGKTEKAAQKAEQSLSFGQRLNQGIDKVTRQYQGFSMIMQDVGKVAQATVGDYMDQASAVRSLSLATGAGYTETSRLIQVFDDAGINTDNLRGAMIAMKNNGIVPSIDSIAGLSDRYRSLSSETARVSFLTDNFGARGVELGKVFDMTGEQIKQAGAAVDSSMIFDDEKIKQSEELRMSIDEFNDSITGMKNGIVAGLLPGWNSLIDGTKILGSALEESNGVVQSGAATRAAYSADIRRLAKETGLSYAETEKLIEVTERNEAAQYAADAAFWAEAEGVQGYQRAITTSVQTTAVSLEQQKELAANMTNTSNVFDSYSLAQINASDSTKELNTLTASLAMENSLMVTSASEIAAALDGPVTNAHQQYTTALSDINAKSTELQATYDKMISQGYNPQSQKLLELKQQIDDTSAASDNLTTSYEKQLEKMQQSTALAGLSTQQQLDLSLAMGWVDKSSYAYQSTLEALNAGYQSGAMSTEQYASKLKDLTQSAADGAVTATEVTSLLDGLDGKVVAAIIRVITQYEGVQGAGAFSVSEGDQRGGAPGRLPGASRERAAGGPVMGGEAYIWQEPGAKGEILVPAGDGYVLNRQDAMAAVSGAMGGGLQIGSITINAQPGQDGAALARQFSAELASIYRTNQNAGASYAGRG